jgi:hypothetical protein
VDDANRTLERVGDDGQGDGDGRGCNGDDDLAE